MTLRTRQVQATTRNTWVLASRSSPLLLTMCDAAAVHRYEFIQRPGDLVAADAWLHSAHATMPKAGIVRMSHARAAPVVLHSAQGTGAHHVTLNVLLTVDSHHTAGLLVHRLQYRQKTEPGDMSKLALY